MGIVAVGDSMETAMTTLTDVLGEASGDQVEESPWDDEVYWPTKIGACNTATGYACFDYLRFVHWDRFGLSVIFSDAVHDDSASPSDDDYWLQVEPRLGGYTYSGNEAASFATPQGVTVGTTAAELSAIYGDAVNFWFGCDLSVGFTVAMPTGWIWGRFGVTADEPDEPEDIDPAADIVTLGAGPNSMSTC